MDQIHDTIEKSIIVRLREHSQTLATAESCTGGLLADHITNIPGASAVFLGGIVSYSNNAKMILLGVSPELLKEKGAVSAEVAAAMAEGVRAQSGATFGVATTGIAGPDGGTPEHPVGTLFLAIAEEGKPTEVLHHVFSEERVAFKKKAANAVWQSLLLRLIS